MDDTSEFTVCLNNNNSKLLDTYDNFNQSEKRDILYKDSVLGEHATTVCSVTNFDVDFGLPIEVSCNKIGDEKDKSLIDTINDDEILPDVHKTSSDGKRKSHVTDVTLNFKDIDNKNDKITKNYSDDEEIYNLSNEIDEVLEKHISSEFVYDCPIKFESRDASVQTTDNALTLARTYSCPVCHNQAEHSNGSATADNPRNKKRKTSSSDDVVEEKLEIGNNIDGNFDDEKQGKLFVSENDQVVPKNPLSLTATFHSSDDPESNEFRNIRTMRIGLSKRQKIKPLHEMTKI